jgi:hypothetical protein
MPFIHNLPARTTPRAASLAASRTARRRSPRASPAGFEAVEEGGRGIDLLDLLAEAWGSTRTATGKTMWFQLPAKASSPEASPAFD